MSDQAKVTEATKESVSPLGSTHEEARAKRRGNLEYVIAELRREIDRIQKIIGYRHCSSCFKAYDRCELCQAAGRFALEDDKR